MIPKGATMARVALSLARGRGADRRGPLQFAERTWGAGSAPAMILRAAIDAGTTLDGSWAAPVAEFQVAAAEFIEAVRPLTVLGRMQGPRRVPMQIRVPRATAGSRSNWVGQAQPIAVSSLALDTIALPSFSLGTIVVATDELAQLATPVAEEVVRNDLIEGVAAATDAAMFDPDSAGVANVSPDSLAYSALKFGSSGSSVAQITSDLERLFEVLIGYGIPMISPYFVMSSRIAFKLATKRDTSGALAFPLMGARGGELFGVPTLVAGNTLENDDSPPSGAIVLLDAAELLVAETDAVEIDLARSAAVELSDAPDAPVTASTVLTSLWQRNLVGWRVVRPLNFQMRRPGAIAALTGCSY